MYKVSKTAPTTWSQGFHRAARMLVPAIVMVLSLPAWAVQPGYVAEVDLGTSDTSRWLNHVQPTDGTTTPVSIGGLDARRNLVAGSDNYMYFKVNDSYAYRGSKPDLYITIHYYDWGVDPGSLRLQYDSTNGGAYKDGGAIAVGIDFYNLWKWKVKTFHVTDAWFGNRQNGGADFRIAKTGGGLFFLDMVYVRQYCRGRADCVRMVPSPWVGGDGAQIRSLFANPSQWTQARSRIDVLGTYDGDGGFGLVPNWELAQWMSLLNQWNLMFSMDTGALAEWSCDSQHVFNVSHVHWDKVINNGGRVDILAVDEPLRKAMLRQCWGSGVNANYWPALYETVDWYKLIRQNYPDTQIYHYMPYPYHARSTIESWVKNLNEACAANGVRIMEAFMIDADWRLFPGSGSWSQVKQLEGYFGLYNIPFHMVYWASRSPNSTSNVDWYFDVMKQALDYKNAGGSPEGYDLVSWLDYIPTSVPETQSYTLTDTLNDLILFVPGHQ